MSPSRPLLVRLVLYSILLVMALVIRHRLHNRPPPSAPAPTTFEISIEDEATPASLEEKAALEAETKKPPEAARDPSLTPKD